jgi:hypothetical protein
MKGEPAVTDDAVRMTGLSHKPALTKLPDVDQLRIPGLAAGLSNDVTQPARSIELFKIRHHRSPSLLFPRSADVVLSPGNVRNGKVLLPARSNDT